MYYSVSYPDYAHRGVLYKTKEKKPQDCCIQRLREASESLPLFFFGKKKLENASAHYCVHIQTHRIYIFFISCARAHTDLTFAEVAQVANGLHKKKGAEIYIYINDIDWRISAS